MAMASSSTLWFRQFQVLVTTNRRLLTRRPIHLFILLFSSVLSTIFAWLTGRDARGPQGAFPPLTECGMVDPYYAADNFYVMEGEEWEGEIPITLNEPWRRGLPVWLLSLGPTFASISAFLILRDELQSKRWGMLKAVNTSVHWASWLCAFTVLATVNSLAGAITASLLPNVHALESVNFASVLGTLLFLNLALVSASFFLATVCGTFQSTTLTLFVILAIMVFSVTPTIRSANTLFGSVSAFDLSLNTYGMGYGSVSMGAGVFWLYASTQRGKFDYSYNYDPTATNGSTTFNATEALTLCEVPLVSMAQSRDYKTLDERNDVSKEDIFQGCYVVAGSSANTKMKSFVWYLLPQYHFINAWSNILGYTSLPGNSFSLAEASYSPEYLAQLELSNYRGGKGYDPSNTNGTSLFSQGSTIVAEVYYDWTVIYSETTESTSNCPSGNASNLCEEYTECYNPLEGYPSSGSPSFNDCIGYLMVLVVGYSLIAGYVIAVHPMENGAAMKFYNPLNIRCRRRGRSTDDGEDGVVATNISKSYGKVDALKPFSLTMKPSEVTALLGHNGAGKSTFVNLLCCAQNATNGDIRIGELSIRSDPQAVRRIIGECKQDDFLWPNLTAREHLELFAGIRGVSANDMPDTVQRWLDSVDLDDVQHVRVRAYSGGMKRRLSVANSTIGDTRVVCLDEPTTGKYIQSNGMDPMSRRFVWKHLSEIKKGRVILLTTHAMEEADLLSDNVAILSHGTLAAYGSPLELKTKYGSSLQFSLICDKKDQQVVETLVKDMFAGSLPFINFSSTPGYSTVTVKKVCKDQADQDGKGDGVPLTSLATFLGWLENENSTVKEFGISNSSLEEVFLAVTHNAPPSASRNENDDRGCCFPRFCGKMQVPASPADVVDTDTSPGTLHRIDHVPRVDISSYSRKLSILNQTKAILVFNFMRNWSGCPSVGNWITFSMFCAINMLIGFAMSTSWPYPSFYLLAPICFLSFMLISLIAPIYSDRHNGLFKMMSTQSLLEPAFLLGTWIYSFCVQFIYSFVLLTLFFGSSIYRTALVPNCDPNDIDCGFAKFGGRPVVHPLNRLEVLSGTHDGNMVSVYAHPASGGYVLLLGIIVVFSLTAPGAVLSSAFLPGFKISLIVITIILLGACLSPMIYYVFGYFGGYWTDSDGHMRDCLTNIPLLDDSTTIDTVDSSFVELVGWAIADQALLCTPAKISILPQMGLFQTLALSFYSEIVFYAEPEVYADQFINQLIEGGASCSLQNRRCTFEYATLLYGKNLGFMFVGAIILTILGLMMATLTIYPTTIVIRVKQLFGTLWNCHWQARESIKSEANITELPEVDMERQRVHEIIQPYLAHQGDLEASDSDPILSTSFMHSHRDELPPVIMHKLRKQFPPLGGAPPKLALKALDLHVPAGEVLGLLGKNGAGKTTALNILAGMHNASSGIALVSGYDVHTELNSVYERLGNCPQFECVWKDQSVQRHLEFYARLKGINDPRAAALNIATAVGLGEPEVYTRLSGALSGGMRRRLSIAVSLLGSPNTLLLDEPTTGLDPSTRNEIWQLLSSFATPERAVVITTHMMLEADVLCSRIAIVARGALKVIGSQQHLKDNYGSGYLLQVNLAQDTEQAIDSLLQFVKKNVHEDAKIATKQAKTIHLNLPREVSIQKLFSCLHSESAASEAMINQFLVSQSSLEDVFLALGE